MPDSAVTVKFTGDVTDLQTKSAIVKAELAADGAAVRTLAKQYTTAGEETKSALAGQLQAAVSAYEAQKTELQALQAEIAKTNVEMEESKGIFATFGEGIKSAGEEAEGLTEKLGLVGNTIGKFGELLAVGFGAEVIGEQINKVAELGESYAQLSEKTGATTQQLAGLKLAASETNTDFDQLGNGLRELGLKMQDALIHPSGESAEAFKKLGISFTDSAGQMLPAVDVFEQISQKLDSFQDGAAKTALAGDLLGARFGSSLIPVMKLVGNNFDDLQQRARAYGLVLSDEQIEAAEQFIEKEKDVQAIMEGVRVEVVGGLLPAFSQLEGAFVAAAQDGNALRDSAEVLGTALKGVVEVGVAVVTSTTEMIDTLVFMGHVIGDIVTAAGGMAAALEGDFSLAAVAVKTATADMENSYAQMVSKISAQENLFDSVHNALWTDPATPDSTTSARIAHQGNGAADQSDSSLPPAPELAPSSSKGDDAAKKAEELQTQIAQDAAEARKQIADSEYQAQVSNWEAEVSQGKITKAQEVQDEIQAQDQMYQAQVAEMQKEAGLLADGTAAKAKALDDIEVLTAEHNAELARLNTELVDQQVADAKNLQEQQEKAAEATQQAWQKAFAPISSAFDSTINGVLQGSETLQQGETKAAQSIALAYIDAAAKKLTSFIASEAMMLAQGLATEAGLTSATVAGNATRLASKNAADATGRSEDIALGTQQINSSAMKAAAGAFSAVAGIPYVGPALAPAAAAAAYTAVMAFDVLSAAGGLSVPAGVNPLVQLHENETVLPAHIAQPLNSALENNSFGGNSTVGDTHMSFNQTVNGSPGQDVAGMMKNAGQAWMAQVIDLTRNGTLRLPGR